MAASNEWTKPRTIIAGEISTKEFWNTFLRDNFTHLKERQFATHSVSAVTTTSTSFVEMTGSSFSITTTGGYILFWASGTFTESAAGNFAYIDLAIDGIRQGHATYGTTVITTPVNNYNDNLNLMMLTGGGTGGSLLGAGAHTCSIYWKTSTGTATATLNFFAMEAC